MVDQATAPSEQGIIHTVTVNSCVSIVIKGGASEGVLVEICIEVEAGWPIEEPFIKGLDPAEGRCASEITLTVFGTNFKPELSIFIPDGIETIYTEFISTEELVVMLFITEDAPPGARPVEVIDLESRAVVAALKEGFTVICPSPRLESRPDLALLEPDWEIVKEYHLLLIVAQVENVGDARAPRAIVQVAS